MKPRDELNASLNSRDEPMTTSPDPITPEDRLVERLEEWAVFCENVVPVHAGPHTLEGDLREAATTIKALTEERDEARQIAEKYGRLAHWVMKRNCDTPEQAEAWHGKLLSRLEAAEARALSVERKLEEQGASNASLARTGPVARPETNAEPSALADLLARVEAAEGPDRELDGAIFVKFLGSGDEVLSPEGRTLADAWSLPAYTASLDAALALVERVLPNTSVAVKRWGSGTGDAEIGGAGVPDFSRARAKTPALALLAAMLRTLSTQPHPEGG